MTEPHQRGKGTAAVVAGALAAVILASGLGAIAFASGESAKPRPPAITGAIRLGHRDVLSGRSVRGELVFENHTSNTKVLMRGRKINGLYAIGLRPAEGYSQEPACSGRCFGEAHWRPDRAGVAQPLDQSVIVPAPHVLSSPNAPLGGTPVDVSRCAGSGTLALVLAPIGSLAHALRRTRSPVLAAW